jgi:hypothetical protein
VTVVRRMRVSLILPQFLPRVVSILPVIVPIVLVTMLLATIVRMMVVGAARLGVTVVTVVMTIVRVIVVIRLRAKKLWLGPVGHQRSRTGAAFPRWLAGIRDPSI